MAKHKHISIHPVAGDVGHTHTLMGRVHPHDALVQVLVLSKDKKWYLQKEATVDKHGEWAMEVTFGDPGDKQSLHEFSVCAFIGPKLKEPTHDDLPPDVVFDRVCVARTK